MTNLTDSSSFPDVYQLETTDDVIGGPGGTSNLQPQQLANRTRWLLNRLQDGGANYAVDGGSANAYTAAISPAITSLADGMEVKVRIANANTGASTFTPNAGTVAALPIYGGDNQALTGGELVLGGEVTLRYNAWLNSPNGGWVIVASSGGVVHHSTPAVGNNTTESATMAALFSAADGMATVDVSPAGDVTLTKAQYGLAMLNLTGTPGAAKNLIFPAQTGFWIIANNQGGTNNITAKTAAGTGKVLPQGAAVIVYCDGTNIAFASSTGNQSSFTASAITGVTGATLNVPGGYTPGNILVEKNGALLQPADFTATDGATITLATAAVAADKFTVYALASFSVANALIRTNNLSELTDPLTARKNLGASMEHGGFKNLKLSATGTDANIAVSYDALVLSDGAGASLFDGAVSATINTATTGAGGLDTGALAGATWYSAWRIAKADGTKSWLISLSATAPTMPTGYTLKRRIGWALTDGTANKYPLAFVQRGGEVEYAPASGSNMLAYPALASGASGTISNSSYSPTAVSVSGHVPSTAAEIKLQLASTGASGIAGASPGTQYGGSLSTNPPPLSTNTLSSVSCLTGRFALRGTSIYYACSVAGPSLNCVGWTDML